MKKLNKYNNVIINKRQDNICELQFINKDQKEIINSDDYAFLEKQLSFFKNRTKEINELKQAVSILSKNKIKSFENKIENISSHEEKLIRGKGSWSYAFFLPKIPLDTIKTKELIVNKKQNIKINIATIYNKDFKGTDIPEPTAEQLNVISKDYSFNSPTAQWDNLEEWRKNYPSSIVSINVFTNNKKRPVINQEEAREIYYKLQEFDINEYAIGKYEKEYLDNITDKELYKHYEDHLNTLNEELKTITKYSKILKKILYENHIFEQLGLATPNDVKIASVGTKQTLKWLDVDDKHKEKVKELLKSTAPEILQKLEDNDNPDEIISHFIGVRLTKIELRILKTLRALVDRAFKLEKISSYSHQVHIITADFYKEYGLKQRSSGGYDNNQTREIRKVLFSKAGNLTKRIFFNNSQNKTVLITAFIMKIDWEEKSNYFKVMLDDIIFVKDGADKYSYYYEDLQGLNRLLKLMPNSNLAFELHSYLEYSLRLDTQEFGITKIIKNTNNRLLKRYQKDKKETENHIEKILNNMMKARTLISKWEKAVGKNEKKYILTNIKAKEISNNFIATKNKKKKNYNN